MEKLIFTVIVVACVCSMLTISSATLNATCTAENAKTVCSVTNSECKEEKCACKAGYAVKVVACVAILDSACTDSDAATVCTVVNSECKESKCACKDGYAAKSGLCEAVCATACANGGTCSSPATCSCTTGWTGDTCGTAVCATTCANGGTCSSPATCSCTTGWTGDTCGTAILDSACTDSNAATVCTVDNSECKESKCACKDGYAAKSGLCEAVCATTCANGGTCSSPDTCSCKTGWTGATCGTAIDCTTADVCANGGTCTDGPPDTCSCAPGYTGSTCNASIVCDPACQNEGVCVDDACVCAGTGYSGETCSVPDNSAGKTGLTVNVILATLVVTFLQKHF